MNFSDTISLSFRTIRSNKLRTAITVTIIALGIAALIGIRTAIEAMQQKFTESFSAMGANGFTIRYKTAFQMHLGKRLPLQKGSTRKKERQSNINKPVTQEQAEAFKERFPFPSQVGLSYSGPRNATVAFEGEKTNPNVWITGGDENYLDLNGFTIEGGRNISPADVQGARNVCLLGKDVAVRLFGVNADRPVGKLIRINNIPFRVEGTLEAKGSTLGRSWDNCVVISYTAVRRFFVNDPRASFAIGVKVSNVKLLDMAIGEAEGVFRPVRGIGTLEEDNFIIDKSDSFVELLLRQLSLLTIAALVIGVITLIGAAIGLMNIMLVAVTERTKEIGLLKAIGGTQVNIRRQFLFESVIISLLGALFGIIAGILLGNIVGILMNTGFVIPWLWVALGAAICSLVGLGAGLYPAIKASRLNPIEALRYE